MKDRGSLAWSRDRPRFEALNINRDSRHRDLVAVPELLLLVASFLASFLPSFSLKFIEQIFLSNGLFNPWGTNKFADGK